MANFERPTDIYDAMQAAAARRFEMKQKPQTAEQNAEQADNQQQTVNPDANRGSERLGFLSVDEAFFAEPKHTIKGFKYKGMGE